MTNADYLPETAAEIVKTAESTCICRWDRVNDPDDIEDAKQFGRYSKTLLVITYDAICGYKNHGDRGKREEKRVVRFLDDGSIEDL